MRYLLDTNAISELAARRPDPRVVEWIDSLDPEEVYLSVITLGELSKGIEKLPDSARKDGLRAWLSGDLLTRFNGRILELDVGTMLEWGRLVARLESRGRTLPAIDSLIAALAIHANCSLVTRNKADFEGTGVQLVNPWE